MLEFIRPNAYPRIEQAGVANHGFSERVPFTQQRCWSLHFYHYSGELDCGGNTHRFHPGWISLIPPNVEAIWSFPEDAAHHYVHFEYDSGVTEKKGALFLDSNRHRQRVLEDLHIITHNTEQWPEACSIRLLNLFWTLAMEEPSPNPQQLTPSAVQIATSTIRNELHTPLRVQDLARVCRVSPGHLSKCFKQSYSVSVLEYIQLRRIEKATSLLEGSDLDIKSIAHAIGIPDLQAFNKFIRSRTGVSPRAYRSLHHSEKVASTSIDHHS